MQNQKSKNQKFKSEFQTLTWALFALAAALSMELLSSCGKNGDGEIKPHDTKSLPLVKVQNLSPQKFVETFKVLGVIKPYAAAKVSAEEGGLIVSMPKDKGAYVSRGEIIARIKKDVEAATYQQTMAQIELAKMNFQKQEELWKENATTEVAYLTAKWQLEAAERGLEILKQRLKTGAVRAPISGIIDAKFMNRGEMAAPGVPIFNIIDISRVKISAAVPEKYLTKIKKGQDVRVTCDLLPGVEFNGKINYVAPSLTSNSRTFEVEIVINNPNRVLKPEMNANVLITQANDDQSLVVPQDLIIDYGDEQFVFVVEADVARKRIIKIGGREGNLVKVESGLNPGDKLVTEGYESLVDGMKVQVVE